MASVIGAPVLASSHPYCPLLLLSKNTQRSVSFSIAKSSAA